MKRTLIALALVTVAGTAGAQTVTAPSAGGATVAPPTATTPAMQPRSAGASVPMPSVGGSVTPAMTGADRVTTPGVNPPGVPFPSVTAPNTANAPAPPNAAGSAGAAARIRADGYKNVQGLTRGPNGTWQGKALRGNTMVDVNVDARGNVTTR